METATETLLPDAEICERARRARDPRFDGRFFIGVRSTGIYCRPICPAPTALASNVSYYATAASAAEAGFRPCLRCRPEAAPGTPAWQGTSTTVARGLRLIGDGALDEGSVESLAERLGVTTRHLSRLFSTHLGASPVAVAQTRRLQFAKRLIDETVLGFADVAQAAGFGSLRRFNHAVRETWGRSPTELRRLHRPLGDKQGLALRIPYRSPFDWQHWLDFLGKRAIPGVERIDGGTYSRVIEAGDAVGSVRIEPLMADSAALITVHGVFPQALFDVVRRGRALLDAEADPDSIAAVLAQDPLLTAGLAGHAGLRVPGAWDPFELAVRAILGQQVSVAAATTLAARLVMRFGRALDTPAGAGLTHLFPRPAALAAAPIGDIGLPGRRAEAIRRLAAAVEAGQLDFSATPAVLRGTLESLPGIGPWTAHYICMRASRDPDAIPAGDLVLRQMLGGGVAISQRAAEQRTQAWSPWRAYGLMHLWAQAGSRNRKLVAAGADPA